MFDVSFLISAEEARERSESACSLGCSTELRIASECINKAVENGEYYCWCNNCLHNQAINKLTKLGYTVTNCSTQREGTCFKIEW